MEFELELSSEKRKQLKIAVEKYTETFLDNISKMPAYVIGKYDKVAADDQFVIDGNTVEIEQALNLFTDRIDNTGLNPASGGHLGYIPGGGIYTSSLGDYIAAVTNRYAGVFFASPGAVRMENALIDWIGKTLGYQNGFAGNLTSGGSLTNLIGLYTAKTAKGIRAKNVESSVIYTTHQSHHSIIKALRVIGLDESILRYVAMDDNFKMSVRDLEAQIASDKKSGLNPFLVIANAGSTDVGAVDPLDHIADITKRENLWLHVDAAYGGFFILTEHGKEALKGIEAADSVILDPHKGMFLPYGSGIVMVKEAKYLLEANSYEAGYMQDTHEWHQEMSPTELSPEMSRNFRGLRMWLPLKLHGIKPFENALVEKLDLISYFCFKIRQMGFELGNQPDLTVAIFRYNVDGGIGEELNRLLLDKIHQDGRVFISSTEINGEFWLRIAILSFRTHMREIKILLSIIKHFLDQQVYIKK